MSNIVKPRILITGATGWWQNNRFSISNTIEIVAAVRTVKKAVLPIKESKQLF
jgi:hypothetical protein